MRFIKDFFFSQTKNREFKKQLTNVLGFTPGDIALYKTALSHRSVREGADENNERLEFLGDAVLSSVIAHYLFRKYPYKGEGFLTEMRSKMVNRQMLNDIALKMGLKKITFYNKYDNSLKVSQIFGNTLEALIGAVTPVVHAVDHAAVHGLQAIAHIGERATDDDAHRVVEVAALHLDLQVDLVDVPVVVVRGRVGAFFVSHCVLSIRCPGSGRPWRCAG